LAAICRRNVQDNGPSVIDGLPPEQAYCAEFLRGLGGSQWSVMEADDVQIA
jgi:hypothetical protein